MENVLTNIVLVFASIAVIAMTIKFIKATNEMFREHK